MTNSGEESQTQAVPAVVYKFWAQLIEPAYQALLEGRHRFGLTDTDILNQALQIWIWVIQASDTSDILVRDRASQQLQQVLMMSVDGTVFVPPAA